ncbi:hypothetical protein BH23PLA1_BH23PLA1_07900 [soil metagenome]
MSVLSSDALEERLGLLGLPCESVPTDHLSSAALALACFPMYMVANCHVWASGKQYDAPEVEWPGAEELLAALGNSTSLEPAHRELLDSLRFGAKPPDRVFYEFALETLALFLDRAAPEVANQTRLLIAQGIVEMAGAGIGTNFATVRCASAKRAYLQHIIVKLRLADTPTAIEALEQLD